MEHIKSNQAITLMALILTVVIMIILTGVSISALTSDNGLADTIYSAKKEYKKQSIIEAIRTAEKQLKTENLFDRTHTIDIVSLINKVKEISDINEKDYIISVDEAEQTATIIDKKTGIVIDITINLKDEVIIDSSIVNDISDAIKPTIEYTLSPKEGEYAEEITITITAKEEKNGIAKIQFSDNAEKTYSNNKTVTETYKVRQNGTYKFTAVSANGRRVSKYIEVKNSMQAGNIVITVTNPEPTKDSANLVITYDPNVKVGGQTLTNANRFQYSIGENNWKTATSTQAVSVYSNSKVYARYFDGINGYKTTTITISNVDRIAPTEFNLSITKTTNSITVSGDTTDTATAGCAIENYGISGYQFQLKDSVGTVIIDWTTKQLGTNYTFTNAEHGIVQGQTYKVSMRAVDRAGNATEATNKDESVMITISINELRELIIDNAIGFPNWSDRNRKTLVSGTEYLAEENLWIINEPVNDVPGNLDITIDGSYYGFIQNYDNVDWGIPLHSMFPIKKGSSFKVRSDGKIYSVSQMNNFEGESGDIDRKKIENIIMLNAIGFPKYDDSNRTKITSNVDYTASENSWLIAQPVTDGDTEISLTVNGMNYKFYKGYNGKDYNHPSHLMFPIRKGDIFNIQYNNGTVYKVAMEYEFEKSFDIDNEITSARVLNAIKDSTVSFPNYNDTNMENLISGNVYTANENSWLILFPKSSSSGSISITVNGKTYNFYQGYRGTDYNHPSHSMFPIKKGSTFRVNFTGVTIKRSAM